MFSILLGSSVLYYLSYFYGEPLVEKFGRFIHLNEKKLKYIERKFRQYGPLVIMIGRHIPGFRIPITVFSGVSRVKYKTFIISEFFSVLVWVLIFMQVGVKLGKRTMALFHNHDSLIFFLAIPVVLTIITLIFGKFIPEDNEPDVVKHKKNKK
jgi:membrane protein DedA with SNARE-associated domain